MTDARPDASPSWHLDTRRMRLRRFRPEDVFDILRLHADARVTRHLIDTVPRDLGQGLGYVAWAQGVYARGDAPGPLHACLRDAGVFVGSFSLVRFADTGELELGGRLLPAGWGRNLALEGGRALLDHAFADLGEPAVISLSHPDNRPVAFILRRLGFRPDGRVQAYGRQALRHVIDRDDWQAAKARPPGRRAS